MNADNVNRWLTLGTNVGVVIGLILLLVELDQNSDLVRAQIHQARSDTQVSGLEDASRAFAGKNAAFRWVRELVFH